MSLLAEYHRHAEVCNPADHEGIPKPGECINCDGERHRLGFRLHAALHHRPHPETQACPHPACPGWAS